MLKRHEWPGGSVTLADLDDAPDDASYALLVGFLTGSRVIDPAEMWELLAERGIRIYTTGPPDSTGRRA